METRKAGDNVRSEVDALRYQSERKQVANTELLNVKIRYKTPDAETSRLLEKALIDSCVPRCAEQTGSSDFRFAAAVAEFGMLLRKSPHKGSASLTQVKALAEGARGSDLHGEKAQFLDMVQAASRLGLGS